MVTVYKVWICVEAYDVEKERGEDLDLPFSAEATFSDVEVAVDYAQTLHDKLSPLVVIDERDTRLCPLCNGVPGNVEDFPDASPCDGCAGSGKAAPNEVDG